MAYNKERYRTLKMVAYYMLLTIWYLLSLLPLWVHYLLSDLLYLIVGYLIPREIERRVIEDRERVLPFPGRLSGRKRETDDHQQEELEKKIGVQRY